MKKRLLKIAAIFIVTLVLAVQGGVFRGVQGTVRAVGDLSVDWGVPEGDPIFVVNNFAPGQTESRDVIVVNNASTIRPVGVRGIETDELGGLADKLLLTISVDGSDLYGGSGGTKTLSEFFAESAGPDGIALLNLNPGVTKTIVFDVLFDPQAGNEFQNTHLVFDLHIGIAINIPDECLGIVISGDPIFGTEGDDYINGTNGNDLIYGFEGNDTINSSNGRDCVIGGHGNDILNNSNGNDVLYGNEGDDILNGSNGNDIMFGGPDKDTLNGSNGNDLMLGNEGDDVLNGSNGSDIMHGGDGNDKLYGSNSNDLMIGNSGNDLLDGGNGSDWIEGNENDDELIGGNSNDRLIGGDGMDKASGNNGSDTCEAEVVATCEL